MKTIKQISIVFLLLGYVFCSGNSSSPYTIEKITFQSYQFHMVGELRLPDEGRRHPLVIMVHGDGPAYRSYFLKLKECMLRTGYATLMWDKPGYGQSKGEFSKDHLREERAEILVDAINHMKNHPRIDGDRIGVWGISQAGYVIPMALLKTKDISFMIMVGCPGENGINQSAYLIRKQLLLEGLSEEEAKQMEDHFIQLFYAKTFEQYIKHAKPLYDNPVQRSLGFVSGLWDEITFKPHFPEEEGFFDPIDVLKKTTIPVLAFFGEKDTQADPIQGVDAYKKALTQAGNKNFRVELIPNADHNIILSKTGSMRERSSRSSKEWQNYAPEYLQIMEDWLRLLDLSSR